MDGEKETGGQSIPASVESHAWSGTNINSTKLSFIADILARDARPSFVVKSTQHATREKEQPSVVYHNPALERCVDLKRVILADTHNEEHVAGIQEFQLWIRDSMNYDVVELNVETYTFLKAVWVTVNLDGYSIISGLPQKDATILNDSMVSIKSHVKGNSVSRSVPHSGIRTLWASTGKYRPPEILSHKQASVFMTNTSPSLHRQSFHGIDWASTELGRIDTWPDVLHGLVSVAMSDPEATMIFWGDNMRIIHNEEAKKLYPHIQLQGSTVEQALPTIWKDIQTIFADVRSTRHAVCLEDFPVLIDRHGVVGECWTSSRLMPIEDKDGKFLGVYETLRETTKEVLSRRRLATLLRVSSCFAGSGEMSAFWKPLLDALSGNKEDVAFALVYSLESRSNPESDPLNCKPQRICSLEGSIGVPSDHISAKLSINLDRDTTGYVTGLMQSLKSGLPVHVQPGDSTLAREYLAGLSCRGYQGSCDGAIVCPIRPTGGVTVSGFVIIGISSHVLYDEEFRQFIDILNRQIATSVAAISLFSEELRKQRERAEEAALVYAKLQQRLEQETKALITSEAKFERHLDKAPIGIIMTNIRGDITYANEAWYQISGHSGADITPASWLALVPEEDVSDVANTFTQIALSRQDTTFEMRYKKEWIRNIDGADPIKTLTTVLVSAYVEVNEQGQVKNIVSAVTDISAQKWAEESHRRRMMEALELKVQQENFIDTISHEIRNPLSAILQSAEEISEYLAQQPRGHKSDDRSPHHSLDAVETITLCCQHQRRIVDDVLTLSKMNADMLMITANENDPLKSVDDVIKMFSADARKHDIQLTLDTEDSLYEMGVTTLLFDSNRFIQVLVNLLGNAIKFTRTVAERRIKISVGTSISLPTCSDHGVDYIQNGPNDSDDVFDGDARLCRKVYLRVVVQDSGVGMTLDEKSQLFKRFSQASPRTQVQYGGSGLGLFISKNLCKLQGGTIGIKMADGSGTTFAFYISARQPQKSAVTVEGPGCFHVNRAMISCPDVNLANASTLIKSKPSGREIKVSVLVVEDNVINQKVLCRQLKSKGYDVYAANHGAEALEFLKETKFCKGQEEKGKDLSLVLLDVEMPIMDGLTCVRQIRQMESEGTLTSHVPVVAVSANVRAQQMEEARLAGMDENLAKPFRIGEVVSKIDLLLNLRSITNHDTQQVRHFCKW